MKSETVCETATSIGVKVDYAGVSTPVILVIQIESVSLCRCGSQRLHIAVALS